MFGLRSTMDYFNYYYSLIMGNDEEETIAPPEDMSERERPRAPPPPEPPPHRVRAADLYPRQRTHYDEPDLDAPYRPIIAESILYVGRTADNGTLALSNYRIHLQPRRRHGPGTFVPVRMIETVEVRDLTQLVILCKDGMTLSCTFDSNEQCSEWWRRITTALNPYTSLADTFAAAYAAWAREQPPASVHRTLLRAPGAPKPDYFDEELSRLGFRDNATWRVSRVNAEHRLCPSYPAQLIVPSCIEDIELERVAGYRTMRRIPAVVWRHRGNGAVIARSSQPMVSWLGWRSSEDERLLAAFVTAVQPLHPTKQQTKLLIVDARSYASAVANRARGGGCENPQYYTLADIQFMNMPNIHHVRKSYQRLRALVAEPPDQGSWHSSLERTLWPGGLCGAGRGAACVAAAAAAGRPVLVHCSDGWDRTAQLSASAQLLLDPYYRTVHGFRVLIEREWLEFGHKFADRCGHAFGADDANERSPIFMQWLDLVRQVMLQYPTSFEFSEAYLIKLLTHVHSCMFGNFLCNSPKERLDARVYETTADVWKLLDGPEYRNHLYAPSIGEQYLWPDFSERSLVPWWALLGGNRPPADDAPGPSGGADGPPAPGPPPPPLAKTRSCDNLLNDADAHRPLAQRRCSDPTISPEALHLANILPSTSGAGDIDRSVLTESILLETIPRNNEQVDGLHLNHFENGEINTTVHDIASNSSSLERELQPPSERSESEPSEPSDSADPDPDPDRTDNERPDNNEDSAPEPSLPVDDYQDIIENARLLSHRARHVSITWRSVSESSHQTDSSIIEINRPNADNANGRIEPEAVSDPLPEVGDSNGEPDSAHGLDNGHENGQTNGHVDTSLIQAELGEDTSSSSSSSGALGAAGAPGGGGGGRRRRSAAGASQATLCPSPRRRNGENVAWRDWCASGEAACVCGGARVRASPDGLPPPRDPLQERLHSIIADQRSVVRQLQQELREARAALQQRLTPPPAPQPPQPHQAANGSSSSSSERAGSGSEVEVGEEARGVAWLPDAAAPRCQYCGHHFWLARRRHHCRRCGGIFCGSCSVMSDVGEWRAVRICRTCRNR